jgi:hypothetical protein
MSSIEELISSLPKENPIFYNIQWTLIAQGSRRLLTKIEALPEGKYSQEEWIAGVNREMDSILEKKNLCCGDILKTLYVLEIVCDNETKDDRETYQRSFARLRDVLQKIKIFAIILRSPDVQSPLYDWEGAVKQAVDSRVKIATEDHLAGYLPKEELTMIEQSLNKAAAKLLVSLKGDVDIDGLKKEHEKDGQDAQKFIDEKNRLIERIRARDRSSFLSDLQEHSLQVDASHSTTEV